jgi:dTDP-4-dehydrorhamnose reductase
VKILLLGGAGQVGWELQRALVPLGDVIAPMRADTSLHGGDLGDSKQLTRLVRTVAPDVIVNAAAYTAVDQAELEPELAHRVNAEAPGVLAGQAAASGALLVHYGTDYVFDGAGSAPWREDDPTSPLNVYGRSKLEGEQRIRGSGCRHLIFRTSWVYSNRRQNFLRTMLRLAAERDTLNVVADQFGAPTGASLLADATAQVLQWVRDHGDRSGVYHLAAAGETNWHAYACHIVDFARKAGYPVRARAESIVPVPSEAYPTRAVRPLNSRLDTGRLRATFGLALPPWQAGVDQVLSELTSMSGSAV